MRSRLTKLRNLASTSDTGLGCRAVDRSLGVGSSLDGARDPIDITKSKTYAFTELLTKLISAIALVALGIAGWLLQLRAQEAQEDARKAQDAAAAFELQERRYLPMLRSLIELEIALKESASDLRMAESGEEYAEALRVAALDLQAAAYSLFLPENNHAVSVVVPQLRHIQSPVAVRIDVELRAAVLMYAEILQSGVQVDDFGGDIPSNAACVVDGGTARFVCSDKSAGSTSWVWSVDPDAVAPLQRWLSGRAVPVHVLKDYYLPRYLDELRFIVAKVIHNTLLRHEDLGDRYVSIRSDAMRAAAERRQSARR